MIRWKVVTWPGRRSMLVDDPKYGLWYWKGARVTARPETLGCMVFKRKLDAKKWLKYMAYPGKNYQILRVRGVGRGVVPKHVGLFITTAPGVSMQSFLDAYYKNEYLTTLPAPAGTICYKQMEVLD